MMNKKFIGLIAGNFDIIHPGYIKMFKECKNYCEILVVLLHEDPSIERPEKLKPILSVDERKEMLNSLEYVDQIMIYKTEADLYNLISQRKPDIRFLGDDYINKPITGDDLNLPIHYLNRDHGWSTTKYKQLIANSIK